MTQPQGGWAAAPPGVATTPDGAVLSGWWRRVAASLIDGVVLFVINVVVGFRWFANILDAYGDYFEEVSDASAAGRPAPSSMDLQGDIAGDMLVLTLLGIVVGFFYYVGFLMWKQATIGKLLVGVRVRQRDVPGPMPLGVVLKRWLAQSGVGALSVVPILGCLAGLYVLLDSLWPLWDDKKQALHDKFAGTNVVLR